MGEDADWRSASESSHSFADWNQYRNFVHKILQIRRCCKVFVNGKHLVTEPHKETFEKVDTTDN
ncbi:hypothetical protein FF38_04421 [Lucilia cuprina]|uniref:Uncharacterized protein n=1 Tax=Lucilia cuprina TaxID=7375 RepID=A0A0L0BRT4_LUCCU|nr:hypothetical protein FF38_04421 [Lucilia cuprina]